MSFTTASATIISDLASAGGVPGLSAAIATVNAVRAALHTIRIHRERCSNLSNRTNQLLVLIQENALDGRMENAKLAEAAYKLDVAATKISKRMVEWGAMGTVRSYMKKDDIARDIEQMERDLDLIAKSFNITAQIEIVRNLDVAQAVRERDQAEIVALLQQILSSREDLKQIAGMQEPQVESLMSSIQEELHRAPVTARDEQQLHDIRRGLMEIRKETNVIPPLPDLSGEIVRMGTTPVAIGGHADVWLGDWLGEKVALKVLRNIGELSDESQRRLTREIGIWKELKHDRIIRLYGVCYIGPLVHMVSPWAHHRDLSSYVSKNLNASRVKLLRQVADGLAYLHGQKIPIIHGDLRSANILVAESGDAMISDFGMSRLEEIAEGQVINSSLNTVGQVRWMAPELLDPSQAYGGRPIQTTQTDCWAFGMVCFEVFSGERPYHRFGLDIQVMQAIIIGTIPSRPVAEELSEAVWNLVLDCWQRLPHNRPRLTDVVNRLARVERVRSGSINVTAANPVRRQPSLPTPPFAAEREISRAPRGVLPPIRDEPVPRIDLPFFPSDLFDGFGTDTPVNRPFLPALQSPSSPTHRREPSSPYSPYSPTYLSDTNSTLLHSSPGRVEAPLPSPPHSLHSSNEFHRLASPSVETQISNLRIQPTSPTTHHNRPGTASSECSVISGTSGHHRAPQRTFTTISEGASALGWSPTSSVGFGLPDAERSLEVRFSGDGRVLAGTLDGLVHQMIRRSYDAEQTKVFRHKFLTLYRAFTNAKMVLNLLEEQHEFASSDRSMSVEERVSIRYNVLEVLREWLEKHRIEIDDLALLQRMKEFAQTIKEPSPLLAKAEGIITNLIQPHISRLYGQNPSGAPPSQPEARLSEITPVNFARHLTIMKSQMYLAILPTDCIAYLKKLEGDAMAAITKFRTDNNKLAAWVQKQILKVREAKDRASKIEFFIVVAQECLRLNNFSSMYSLVMALQSSVIKRLKHTQRMVGKTYIKQLRALSEIVDHSNHYHRYRQCLKNADGPVIPIINVHLADLARNHQGGTSTIQGEGRMLINFRRYEQLLDGVKESLRYQETKHDLQADPPVLATIERQLASITLGSAFDQMMERRSEQIVVQEEEQSRSLHFALQAEGFVF